MEEAVQTPVSVALAALYHSALALLAWDMVNARYSKSDNRIGFSNTLSLLKATIRLALQTCGYY